MVRRQSVIDTPEVGASGSEPTVGRVDLLGHCMGGNAVLWAVRHAAEYDLQVRSVLLINTSPKMPPLTRHKMTQIRLQEIRGFAGLPPSPAIDAATEDTSMDDLIRQVFTDVRSGGALWEKTFEAFLVRLDVYVSSWQAAATFEHVPFDVPLRVMYDPHNEDWLYGGKFDVETWLQLGYSRLSMDGHPDTMYRTIGSPGNLEAIASFLNQHDER